MLIKAHPCGLATCFEPFRKSTNDHGPGDFPGASILPPSRPHGSRYSQQKKIVANAIILMRAVKKKPLIFVATTPGLLEIAKEKTFISKLTHNLRNGYGVGHYVWVREYTLKGYPHYHFVVDVPWIDAKKISLYWSGLFGKDAPNSIRLGFKPRPGNPRRFYVNSDKLAWYYSKYLTKAVGKLEEDGIDQVKGFRAFGISQELRKMAEPVTYESKITMALNGRHVRQFDLIQADIDRFDGSGFPMPPSTINPRSFSWRWTGYGSCYSGAPKSWGKKNKEQGGGMTSVQGPQLA